MVDAVFLNFNSSAMWAQIHFQNERELKRLVHYDRKLIGIYFENVDVITISINAKTITVCRFSNVNIW